VNPNRHKRIAVRQNRADDFLTKHVEHPGRAYCPGLNCQSTNGAVTRVDRAWVIVLGGADRSAIIAAQCRAMKRMFVVMQCAAGETCEVSE
jgi:hypothetical protein